MTNPTRKTGTDRTRKRSSHVVAGRKPKLERETLKDLTPPRSRAHRVKGGTAQCVNTQVCEDTM